MHAVQAQELQVVALGVSESGGGLLEPSCDLAVQDLMGSILPSIYHPSRHCQAHAVWSVASIAKDSV